MATMTADASEACVFSILAATLPAVRNPSLRREGMIARSAAVRSLLKGLGIKGVSVRTPNYSMARAIEIRIPWACEIPTVPDPEGGWPILDPEHVAFRGSVRRKLTAIVLAAFPDLDDRSDSLTDHYDYCFSID